MGTLHPYPMTLAVTSSSGTGSNTFKATGQIITISIKPASGNPTYDYDISDSSGYSINGRVGNTGATTIVTTVLCNDTYTVTISNATSDIVYNFRFWILYGT